jgi:lysophospholipase L1-like esterase
MRNNSRLLTAGFLLVLIFCIAAVYGCSGADTGTDGSSSEAPRVVCTRASFKGKKVSVLGDSISTFEGYIPLDYRVFYPKYGGIERVEDTWWMQVISDTHAHFCADASYSGSTVCGQSEDMITGRAGTSSRRISDLTAADGSKPDIVIIYMGVNDLLRDYPIGDNDGTRPVDEGEVADFSDAYTLLIDKIHAAYPKAQICCVTFHEICRRKGRPAVEYSFMNERGYSSRQYNDAIRTIAANKGLPVFDVYHGSGINIFNAQRLTIDGTHPNRRGARKIAGCILRELK